MAAASRGAEAATASLVTRITILDSTTLAGGLAEVASEPGQGEAPEEALEWQEGIALESSRTINALILCCMGY